MGKMNSKRRKGCPTSIPSYKFWLFSLGSSTLPPHLFAIWCEKGDVTEPPRTLTLPKSPDPGSLEQAETEDYSFPHLPSDTSPMEQDEPQSADEDELKVEQLSFLRGWVSEELAKEFG